MIFKFIAKATLFSVGLILILELVTWVFIPQQLIRYDSFYQGDPTGLGRVPAANVDTVLNSGEGDIRFMTNAAGMRVGAMPVPTDPDVRVLMLGDSYMEAIQVEYEETTDALLEQALSEALGATVVVDNRSSASFNINHYAIALEQSLGATAYDMAVVFINPSNDFIAERVTAYPEERIRVRRLRLPHSLAPGEVIDAVLYPINDTLERNSHLFVLLKQRFADQLARLGLSARRSFPWVLARAYADLPRWETTAERLDEMDALATAHDVPIVFVVVPMATQIDTAWLDFYRDVASITDADIALTQPQEKLREAAERYGFTLVDPYAQFQATADAGTQLFGQVDTHYTAAGHRLMTEQILPTLRAHLDAASPH